MGNRCTNPEQQKKKEEEKEKEKYGIKTPKQKKTLTCDNKFSDVFIGVKVDDSFESTCVSGCATEEGDIFGNTVQSQFSSVCKAAFQDGFIEADGGTFMVLVKEGLDKQPVGPAQRGVTPKAYGNKTKFSFSMDRVKKDTSAVKKDKEVDVMDLEKCWLRGKVVSVGTDGQASVKVAGKDTRQKLDVIKPCGDKIKEIACKGDAGPKSFRISFQSQNQKEIPEN